MRQPREPLILIEWTRLACALGIVALHYGVTFWHAPSLRSWHLLGGLRYRAEGEAIFTQGWIGVELFFVISGMMIAQSGRGASRAVFLRRRLERLVPGAWICATLTLAVVGLGLGWDGELLAGWLRSVAFCPVLGQIDDCYWTLGIELSFYLAITVLLNGRGSPVIGPALMIGGASALFWLSDFAGVDPWALSGDRLLQLALLPHGCFFALGMMLAHTGERRVAVCASIAAVMLVAGGIEIVRHAEASARLTGIATPAAVPLGLFLLGVTALIAAPRLQRPLSRWCTPATARRWGGATYPLYLIHQDAGAAVVGWLGRGGMPVGAALLVTAVAAIGVSLAISSQAEPALRRWLRADPLRRTEAVREPAPERRFAD